MGHIDEEVSGVGISRHHGQCKYRYTRASFCKTQPLCKISCGWDCSDFLNITIKFSVFDEKARVTSVDISINAAGTPPAKTFVPAGIQ